MSAPLGVGTRGSALARAQTDWVLASLRRSAPELRLAAVPIVTRGDRDRTPGSSPDFTDAIDRALLGGQVALAVHSAKDLPLALDPGLTVAAFPRREDPRDCVVAAPRAGRRLPRGATVGSSSARRRAQLARWRPDLRVREIRGNVDRRVARVRAGELDAVVLAVAGLRRLGRSDEASQILPISDFLPAPAQGALAVVLRRGDAALARSVGRIDHRPTRLEVTAEREFARELGGDCTIPLGARARAGAGCLALTGELLSPDGRWRLRTRGSGTASDPGALARRLARRLADRGAADLVVRARRRSR